VLFDVDGNEVTLPRSEVFKFDPRRKFKKLWNSDGTYFTAIAKSNVWLQPVEWNQGGYDAIYVDSMNRSVIFVQLTRSHQHHFQVHFFDEVLQDLQATTTTDKKKTKAESQSCLLSKWTVNVYFVVKESQLIQSKICQEENRERLSQFNAKWKQQPEGKDLVRICAMKVVIQPLKV